MNKTLNSASIIILCFFILICTSGLVSCRKDSTTPDPPSTQIKGLDSTLVQWGQTVNGRWVPYLLNKAKRENPGLDNKSIAQIFLSYLKVINNANELYRGELISKRNFSYEKSPKILDSLYKVNYTFINQKMGEAGVMDALWGRYQGLSPNIAKRSNAGKISTNPPVEIFACQFPMMLQIYFPNLSIFPNVDNTPIDQLMNMMNGGCRVNPLARIGIAVYNMRAANNPDAIDCATYSQEIEFALDDYLNCPDPENDAVPLDPYPPGGGNNGGGNPENPSNTLPPEIVALQNHPLGLYWNIPCATLKKWLSLAKLQPDQSIIDKLQSVSAIDIGPYGLMMPNDVATIQKINDAFSVVVNMDYFSVTVTDMPTINGHKYTAAQFMRYLRLNINMFTGGYAYFTPYNNYGINDTQLWNSVSPKGSIIKIDVQGPDNGSVITSASSSDYWTFTTIREPVYGIHPVSGNRSFGFEENSDGSVTFYTRGVDRLTTPVTTFAQDMAGVPFNKTKDLWEAFQQLIVYYVELYGGQAHINPPEILHPNWPEVQKVLDGQLPLSTFSNDCPD